MRESVIEQNVCTYGKFKKWKIYKWCSPNNKAVPDRIFIKNSIIIFIEFKATGKKPTKLQLFVHSELKANDCKVYVIDSISKGRNLIDSYEKDTK